MDIGASEDAHTAWSRISSASYHNYRFRQDEMQRLSERPGKCGFRARIGPRQGLKGRSADAMLMFCLAFCLPVLGWAPLLRWPTQGSAAPSIPRTPQGKVLADATLPSWLQLPACPPAIACVRWTLAGKLPAAPVRCISRRRSGPRPDALTRHRKCRVEDPTYRTTNTPPRIVTHCTATTYTAMPIIDKNKQ